MHNLFKAFNTENFLFSVVSQFFESQVSDVYVIKGNAAVISCNIPSFVSDHVEIIEWVDSNGAQYNKNSSGIIKNLLTFQLFLNGHPQ